MGFSSVTAEGAVVGIFRNSGGCLFGIPFKDSCRGCIGAETAAGAAVTHADILLGVTVHEVQQETIGHILYIDRYCLGLIIGAIEATIADGAVEPERASSIVRADGVGYAFP